ncbi:hypothetical protein RB595_002760 [Gaeumannomyces hyphopodioides]
MDVISPLPIFSLAGVATSTPAPPPKTRVVLIHGLRGPAQSGLIPWVEHWLPPDSSDDDFIFHSPFKPPEIVGRGSAKGALETAARDLLTQLLLPTTEPSYVLWAEDLGGTVVKLALAIAATESGYRPVLDAIQAIVFFGTPHRASSTHSLDSTILSLIEGCYKDLLGDWIPELVNRLSRQLEDIHERFGLISHRFSIISHYQRPSSSGSYRVLVTEDCATLGLSNEISIGCDRPHKDMPVLMGRQQQSVLQVHLINAKITHWSKFQHFSRVLESAYSRRSVLELPMWSLSPSTRVVTRCSGDVKLADWVSAMRGPRYLHVQIGSPVDATKLLHSIASAIWRNPNALWTSWPSADLADTGSGAEEPVGIYVRLLRQIIAQQPRAFLHMQHLAHLATDAIGGRLERWKERILWVCLEALIHAPLGIHVYGFLHIKTAASIEIVQKISSAVQGTDSMFRLVLVSTANAPVIVGGLECVDLEFQHEDLEDCRVLDTNELPGTLCDVGSSLMDTEREKAQTSSSVAAAGGGSEQLLALRIQTMGRSVFIALTWIAFATRPLFRDELEMFLAFDRSSRDSDQNSAASVRSGLAPRLPELLKLLPDIVFVDSGRIYLCIPYDRIRHVVLQLWQTHADTSSSPQLYMAHSCLTNLVKHILNATENENVMDIPDGKSDSPDSSSESNSPSSDAGNEPEETEERTTRTVAATATVAGAESPARPEEGQSDDQVKPEEWAVDRLSRSQEIAAEYAAKNWIVHYQLAGIGGHPEHDVPFSTFTSDDTKVRDWLCLVEYLACAPSARDVGNFASSSLTRLRKYLDIMKLEDLDVLYALATRPSSAPGPDRLLIYAAESGNEVMVRSIISSELGSLLPAPVHRALATSSGYMHDELRKCAAALSPKDDIQWLALVQVTAQVLGHGAISKRLSAELLALGPGVARESWSTDALHRAIEYGDDEAIEDLLKDKDLTKSLESGHEPRWTAMHAAADRGSLQVMTRLWDAGFTQSVNIASPDPDRRNPLFIACSRGFAHIADFLVSKGAHVDDANGPLEQTALHAASHRGHWNTATTLIDKADITSVDSDGNFSLHLAIQQGHVRIAERLVEAFPDIPTASDASQISDRSNATTPRPEKASSVTFADESPPVGDSKRMSIFERFEDRGDHDAMSTVDDDSLAPLNRANLAGVNALFAAADRDLPTVGRRLLERRADPNILGDRSRLALHMAAKAGSASLITDLLNKDSAVDQAMVGLEAIPLHYSCYQGHVDAVKLLADRSDLTSKDADGRTALSAACAGGHLPVATFLMSRYDRKDWVPGLVSAAHYGHRDVARHLLDMGCPVNGTEIAAGQMAFLSAISEYQSRMAELLLLRNAAPVMTSPDSENILFDTLRAKELDTFRLLIDLGADIEAARDDDDGFTILTGAMFFEYTAFVRLLFERGAKLRLPERWKSYDGLLEFSHAFSIPPITSLLLGQYVMGRGEDGMTAARALIVAMKRQSRSLLKLVLKKWFPPNGEGRHEPAGEALHYAASRGSTLARFLKVMLRNRAVAASIDHQQPGLGTPLHAAIAAPSRSQDMVKMLLKHGADAKIVAGRFGTTLNAACVAANLEIVEDLVGILPMRVIFSTTGKYGTAIQSAVVGCRDGGLTETAIKMLDLLAAKDCSVLRKCGFYGTALHAAISFSLPEVIDWLVKENWIVAISWDHAGIRPPHLAIALGNWGLVEKLAGVVAENLSIRLDMWLYGITDYQSRNGIHFAAVSKDEKIMAKALSLCSGNPDADEAANGVDADGWTPLHWACRQGKKEIVESLLNAGADREALTKKSWTPRHIAILHGVTDEECLRLLPDSGTRADDLPEGAGHRFEKECGVCLVEIYWKCYRCKSEECSDGFHLCFKCYRHAGSLHIDGHEFECMLE